MFLLFILKLGASHLRPKLRTPERRERGQAEQTMSLCPPPAREAARGLRALQAQLSSPPSAPTEEDKPLPSLPPSYSEAVSNPLAPLYPGDPPKYSELPEGGSVTATVHQERQS